jgi:hypothetical protein
MPKNTDKKTTLIKGDPEENCPKLMPGLKYFSKVKKRYETGTLIVPAHIFEI